MTRGGGLPMSHESRIVYGAAGALDDGAFEALLRAPVRWGALARVAVHERVAMAVHERLARARPGLVPAEVLSSMAAHAAGVRMRMTYVAHRLDRTLAALDAAHVPVVLLKGAALGRTVYRSLAERSMGDLDLLVPAAKGDEALAAALADGWRRSEFESPELGAFYADHYHLPPLRDARVRELHLELHTDLLASGHPFGLTTDDVWRAARPLAAGGALVPDPVHGVLHLCMHFVWSHMLAQGGGQAIRDLHHVLAAGTVDWDALVREAGARRARDVCFWTFHLARRVAGVVVPDGVEAALAPRRSPFVIELLARHFATLMDPLSPSCPSVRVRRAFWRDALLDDMRHATTRGPWEREHLFVSADAAGERSRLARRLRDLGHLARYASALAFGR
jgi:hypothetical protein